ncbi:Uncharacterised protein [Mycobacteroides abscessus subsp. abscessus]|nr:Uncharacterised protein [Mycobacteroides abscessus subsp. abscessus]
MCAMVLTEQLVDEWVAPEVDMFDEQARVHT